MAIFLFSSILAMKEFQSMGKIKPVPSNPLERSYMQEMPNFMYRHDFGGYVLEGMLYGFGRHISCFFFPVFVDPFVGSWVRNAFFEIGR